MKPSKYAMKLAMWALMLGIAAYFVAYTVHYFFGNLQTELLYTYQAEECETVNGYLFRQETVIPVTEPLVEATVAEGEKVALGGTLALIYDSEEAMQGHQHLADLQNKLDILLYIRSHSGDDSDTASLDSQIADAIVALRTQVNQGELGSLSTLTSELKNLIYRQDYTYNGNDALDLEISALRAEVNDLSDRVGSNVSTLRAEESGIFSSQVDGYETVLTLEALSGLTPSGLEALAGQRQEVTEGAFLGKLITSERWYYAANISEAAASRLTKGGSATLRFPSVGSLTFTVESLSEAEEGQVAAVFSTNDYLSRLTLLRDQTVELVLNTVTGYRVPTSAVQVGNNAEGEAGVYRVYGTKLAWVPVDVLYRGEDYCLISQTVEYDENGEEKPLSTIDEAKRLREGAEIVTGGRELYDGKVIS